MAAYLIVDVDDLFARLQTRSFAVDLHDLATRLRGNAALAAGLFSADALKAIAAADWDKYRASGNNSLEMIFEGVGFETFDVPHREQLVDSLVMQYFELDPQPVDELIVVTSAEDVLALMDRIKMSKNARVRVWGDQAPVHEGTIYQPLGSILGVQSKTVALYIDFENIAISLNEQGYAVNLERLIEGINSHASAHGQITAMAAYAPWGQRGSLPPLVDDMGREVSDDAPSRLALANIDPVFNLPGKNSADMRIAKDVLADSQQANAADVYIIASGDRDFNDVFGALRARNKQVIVWGVRGSTSRILENNPSLQIEYLDDFLQLRRHEAMGHTYAANIATPQGSANAFTPSQWSSVVLQYDLLAAKIPGEGLPIETLQDELRRVSAVVSDERGKDLVSHAIAMGILKATDNGSTKLVYPAADHSIVERTRLVRDRIAQRVANTLEVRGWEYVNYGFLLKGIAMDRDLDKPGLNIDDAWRSDWVDCLIREGILVRELIPHRHNPEDLVPVIRLPDSMQGVSYKRDGAGMSSYDDMDPDTEDPGPGNTDINAMLKRVIVSVDQFTSYRGFTWCPLGSLHRRLRAFDSGVTFQRAVEWLIELGAVRVDEYENPQSAYKTKGISLVQSSLMVQEVLRERDNFVTALLELYESHQPINFSVMAKAMNMTDQAITLWLTIMQAENILSPVQGKPGLYSLFRTHHTVNLVAEARHNS